LGKSNTPVERYITYCPTARPAAVADAIASHRIHPKGLVLVPATYTTALIPARVTKNLELSDVIEWPKVTNTISESHAIERMKAILGGIRES
jgi:hypothetical protein